MSAWNRGDNEPAGSGCAPRGTPDAEARTFPIQDGDPIPWAWAEVAYRDYSKRYGTEQSLERLAQRGGFGLGEWAAHYLAVEMPHGHGSAAGRAWNRIIQRALLRAASRSSGAPASRERFAEWLCDNIGDQCGPNDCEWRFAVPSQREWWLDMVGRMLKFVRGSPPTGGDQGENRL